MGGGLAHQALHLYLPLLLLGGVAGLLQALARRSADRRRRRLLDVLWVALLLGGAPLYLLVAGSLGWLDARPSATSSPSPNPSPNP